ncbi:Agamous-like mads-box protein agl82 [Thalictrum thalictroides]|uniref:Agamous-like mads-box protein agl82 n=1 Tax=Thalictrum thalictroides TaxID=46969 RepID=A0A7J6XCY4_THATH|nr:Agamous-like mads-box protein agl82 [Thalictrum thalictroides]
MGRAKLDLRLIGKQSVRNATFVRRKKGLENQIYEFATLCGVDACMIIYGSNNQNSACMSKPETWPKNQDEVYRIIDNYKKYEKEKRSLSLADSLLVRKKKLGDELAKLRKKNDEIFQQSWEDRINELSKDQMEQILLMIDSKIKMIDDKITLIDQMNQNLIQEAGTGMFGNTQAPAAQNEPFFIPINFNGNAWNDNVLPMQTQPISYAFPPGHHMMQMEYPSNLPMFLDQGRMMNSMMMINGNNGDFSNMVPAGDLSYLALQHPYYQDQGLRTSDEYGLMDQAPSTLYLPANTQSTSSPYVPDLMPGSSDQLPSFRPPNF